MIIQIGPQRGTIGQYDQLLTGNTDVIEIRPEPEPEKYPHQTDQGLIQRFDKSLYLE